MRHVLGPVVLSFVLGCFPAALSADVMVSNSLNLTSLQVTSPGGSVQLSLTASAFGQVFDSLGGSDYGYDPGPVTASASAATTLATWAGSANSINLTASSSSGVNIPGGVANAGTVPGGTYGDLQGMLQILAPTTTSVTVNFLAALSGMQSLMTDADGILATSEVTFNLVLCCTGSTSTTELFYDSLLQIGPSDSLFMPVSTTPSPLTHSDTLMTNTPYSFDAQVDAESSAINTPANVPEQPSSLLLLGTVCLFFFFLAGRFRRARQ